MISIYKSFDENIVQPENKFYQNVIDKVKSNDFSYELLFNKENYVNLIILLDLKMRDLYLPIEQEIKASLSAEDIKNDHEMKEQRTNYIIDNMNQPKEFSLKEMDAKFKIKKSILESKKIKDIVTTKNSELYLYLTMFKTLWVDRQYFKQCEQFNKQFKFLAECMIYLC